MMKSKVTSEPAVEPITLAEVKSHLNISGSDDDTLITEYIKAARQLAEDYTGLKFITQTLEGYSDNWDGGATQGQWWSGRVEGAYFSHVLNGQGHVTLDHGPCQSITTFETIDQSNAASTFNSSNYYLENFDNRMFPRIHLNDGATLPTALRQHNGIKITYVAGFGDTAADVPSSIKHALKYMTAELYEKRGGCDDCVKESGMSPILKPYRIKTV